MSLKDYEAFTPDQQLAYKMGQQDAEAERDRLREALWEICGSREAGPIARRIAGKALDLNSPGAIHVRPLAGDKQP